MSISEPSIRQSILNGNSKLALDRAKEFHKQVHTAQSEELLLDAYESRIVSLVKNNLTRDAIALMEIVRERFPAAQARFQSIETLANALGGSLDGLLRPLADPSLDAEQRTRIEKVVETELSDLDALAQCRALPEDHPLRSGAAALGKAFRAVTRGPVAEEELALPEISRKSPLAQWKLLIRAIGCFYRREDDMCRETLETIKAASVAGRAVPALRAMLGDNPGVRLTPASSALKQEVILDTSKLRASFQHLDVEFRKDKRSAILHAIRVAVEDCRRIAPELLERLKQLISVRCAVERFEPAAVQSSMGGRSLHDAHHARLLARVLEDRGDPDGLIQACLEWSQFLERGVAQGLFPSNGAEVAQGYLHMAGLLGKVPSGMISSLRVKGARNQSPYFLDVGQLYERACELDPHTEAFAKWMAQIRQHPFEGGRVAQRWHKRCPGDLEPVLFLIDGYASRSAFPSALQWLATAERINSVHPEVRKKRVQLLVCGALRQIHQKRPHLARQRLDELMELPELRQGDQAALPPAIQCLILEATGEKEPAAAARNKVEEQLKSEFAAALLLMLLRKEAKLPAGAPPKSWNDFTEAERHRMPDAVSRVHALAKYVNLRKPEMPMDHLQDVNQQLKKWMNTPAAAQASLPRLEPWQLEALAEAAFATGFRGLAYLTSTLGLEYGAPHEARFLLLRAKAVQQHFPDRRAMCAVAAAVLARQRREMAIVDEALDVAGYGWRDFKLTAEQAIEVVRRERSAPQFPLGGRPGPDYSDFFHRDRQIYKPYYEDIEDDEEEDLELDLLLEEDPPPPGVPLEFARDLLDAARQGSQLGLSLDEILSGFLGRRKPRKKAGRRR